MRRRKTAGLINKLSSGRKLRGFTLAELIVVLAILAILAVAGVFTAVTYINKSKFDKNTQNAITVYQTAQTSLTKKTANGTMDSWVKGIPGFDENDPAFVDLTEKETNYSRHKTIALTYNKQTSDHDEDSYLYDLLSPYFYNRSVFDATMTVELDICATKNNGVISYSATVLSAFYSAENVLPSSFNLTADMVKSGGWNDKCTNGSSDGLPDRSDEYRGKTSFVGYYDGHSEGEALGNLSTVIIPWDPTYELQGHIIGPTEDESQAKGYLFNLRNGETLDLSWAVFDDDRNTERDAEEGYNYRYSAREDHNETMHFYLHEDGKNENIRTDLYIDHDKLAAVRYDTAHVYRVFEEYDNYTIIRESVSGYINVNVKINDGSAVEMTFPITKTLVKGDSRTGCPVDAEEGYYEYSLALDAIMSRGTGIDNVSESNRDSFYGVERLFGDRTPRNIFAMLCSDSYWNYIDENGTEKSNRPLVNTYAARAINDPVYLYTTSKDGDHMTYAYVVRENCAKYDGKDDTEHYEDYIITGQAIVNTYFGDKVYDTDQSAQDSSKYIGGTQWSAGEAVLTNCRHLYNIRWMQSSGDQICYRIVSDINWYVHSGEMFASEVKVFTKTDGSTAFCSPVASDGSLRTVSFPAINNLPEGSTLTSISDSDRKTYKINGIQLRAESFINSTDKGYGLFCENFGTIYNVYINDLSLIMASVTDGSACDYTGGRNNFNSSKSVTVGNDNGSFENCPAGSLVGYNKGIIGSPSEEDESINTVQVTNTVVMSGKYWVTSAIRDAGGVIGKNEGRSGGSKSTYGLIKTGGRFIVIATRNAGGIIGYNNSDINARLVVDGENYTDSEFSFPKINPMGKVVSSAVISGNRAGGAIGQFDAGFKFARNVERYSITSYDSVTGEPIFDEPSAGNFHISVTLPENSLILHLSGTDDSSAGGAIGFLNTSSGEYLSIYTNVSGYIISSLNSGSPYCGGAIGKEINCSIKDIYLECNNKEGSLIGCTSSTVGAVAAGGAYGRIDTNTLIASDRTIAINVYNDGTISSRGNGNGFGSGGAIGGAAQLAIPVKIRVYNDENSVISGYGELAADCNGTGGAVGGIGNKDTGNDKSVLVADSVVFADNRGTISGKYHVGGTFGNGPLNRGEIYAVNYGVITGIDFVGGAVGRTIKEQSGTVQSILSGAEITGRNFVGGAAGRLLYFQNGAVIRTRVEDSSSVSGSGYLVGGVCGDILINSTNVSGKVELKGSSTNPTLTVKGGTNNNNAVGTGGIAGVFRTQTEDTVDIVSSPQTDLNRVAVQIDGRYDVGGVIGRLVNNNSTSNTPTDCVSSASALNFNIKLDVELNPQSHVCGTGNNVGGAIGSILSTGGSFTGYIDISSVYGNSSGESYIKGNKNVGGAVGSFSKSLPVYKNGDSEINVDFTRSAWTIEGTIASGDANVGGAVGYISANKVTATAPGFFDFTVKLGDSDVTSKGSNIGGAVGFNENSLRETVFTVQLDKSGSVSGHENVGGAIGKNTLTHDYGYIKRIDSTINGDVVGTYNNTGGAIGYNMCRVTDIYVTVNGSVQSTGNRVGGAIGYSNASNTTYLIGTVDATIQGSGRVEGKDHVGGAVGMSVCNTEDMNATITGNAKVIGENGVGGTLGFASAQKGQTGTNILKGSNYGRILRLKVNISADHALIGNTRIGGAVGQIGEKVDGSDYNSACVVNVEATLNSAYLFDPNETGTTDEDGDQNACVGGIVGIFVDGRLGVSSTNPTQTGGVYLKGSGSVVRTEEFIDTKYFPARTYGNTVFIGANGCSIGGIVGQIGYDNAQQNVCLSNISVKDGPDLCVVSMNGKDRIGGWIGSGYAAHGGIGNNNADEFDSAPVTYNVDNVRAVISIGGSEIGGFCGRSDAYNNYQTTNQIYTFANINVDLKDANIIGSSKVGGAFGETYCLNYMNGTKKNTGSINVTLSSYTNIGDVYKNVLPGADDTEIPICYEAGGAIGCIDSNYTEKKTRVNTFYIPITVTIDSTSRVSGMASPEGDASLYGVGGAFGYCNCDFKTDKYNVQSVTVISKDGSVPAVISGYVNAGGVAGIIDRGNLKNASANVTVSSTAANAGVGGVVGRTINSIDTTTNISIENCHFGPDAKIIAEGYFDGEDLFGTGAVYDPASYHVVASGASVYAGGFAGTLDSGVTLLNCYTTATVDAKDSGAAGGFIGKAGKGTVTTCYAGGHTYSKHYVSNNANVTGSDNVGGFIGQTTGALTVTSCYSTASVYGSGSNVGGFIGSSAGNTVIKTSYCTGLVTCADAATTGSFVGNTVSTTYTDSCSMNGINKYLPLAGNVESISGLYSRNASEINGGTAYTAHPFDKSIGNIREDCDYGLRAVIGGVHWGDWPEADDERINISLTKRVLDPNSYEYIKSGNYHLEEHLTITDENGEEPVTLHYGVDYTLEYANVSGIGKNAQVIITGIGNYYGAVSETFEITKAFINNASVDIHYPEGSEGGFEYTGATNVPVSVVTLGDDVLTEGIDYYLKYTPDNINIGPVTVSVVGYGNYQGGIDDAGTFNIIGRNLGAATVTRLNATEEYVYDGSEKRPEVIVRIDGKTLVKGRDYDVEYINNVNAGTATIKIVPAEGTDQYTGSTTYEFTIAQATNTIIVEPEIAGWTWNSTPSELNPELRADFGTPEYSVYRDAACSDKVIGPYLAADLQEAMRSLGAGSYYLLAEIEEEPEYRNYTGVSKIVPFTVSKWDFTGEVTVGLSYTSIPYKEGISQTPNVTVTYKKGEETLTLDPFNYNVDYGTDTVNVGIKTVTITGKNNCLGTATATYEIIPVHMVTFHADPGAFSNGNATMTDTADHGNTVDEPTAVPEYTGYRFDGWYWYPNPSSFVLYDFTSAVTSDLDLYAHWTEWRYVTFVLNNGEQDIVIHVGNGEYITDIPADPTKEGYDFAGWYGDSEFKNKWDSFNVPIEGNFPVYAKWTPQTHTADFSIVDDTENTVASQQLEYPAQLTRPDDPVREGYYLDGWYSDEDCTQPFEDFDKPLPQDVHLYAKWELQEYTVVFETNGGTEIQSLTLNYQDMIAEPEEPKKEGLTFDGWYTDVDCTIPFVNFDKQIIEFEDRVSKVPVVITLYAKWKNA